MKNRNLNAGDDWATPNYLYTELDAEFGFDFDPCPLHSEFDGLETDWGEVNFVNPPYSRKLKDAFVKKAIEQKLKGRTSVLLLPVSTSTVLFHDFIKPNADEIRFLRGRVKFVGINTFGEKVSTKAGMHDSMIVIMKGCVKNKEALITQAALDALPKWTKITDDPETWPEDNDEILVICPIIGESFMTWHPVIARLHGGAWWRPLCSIDYPPTDGG